MSEAKIFDDWPERYDQWFETPIGELIKHYESELVLEMLKPGTGEHILDAGCGTGVFTRDILSARAHIVGLELSLPMLLRAGKKLEKYPFQKVQGEMRKLPFADDVFDKAISVTALEFIGDAKGAVGELFRVTQPGGYIVVATLNSLSPWASRRKAAAKNGHPIFRYAFFRSPHEMSSLSVVKGLIKTAIHFQKEDDPEHARKIEEKGRSKGLDTGAFIVACWEKPLVSHRVR
jgi:ubiquinone/menaquinone biosynthesis C-methylase UbiE